MLGVFAANLENLYGAFLTAFTTLSPSGKLLAGARGRLVATTVVAALGTVIAIAASSNFLTNLSNFVLFLLYFLIPWTAINLTDYYLVRHGKYDIPSLFETRGRYGAVSWAALGIYVLTVLVELPFMNSSFFEGPIAKAIGGGDIAWIVGLILASGLYYLYSTSARRAAPQEADVAREAGSGL